MFFGFTDATVVDSLRIVWPDNTSEVLQNVQMNQTLNLEKGNTQLFDYEKLRKKEIQFERVEDNLGIDFTHVEDDYLDFNRQKLIPYQVSQEGPALAIGDLNNDGLDDLFFGGSKFKPSKVYIQSDSSFIETRFAGIAQDSIKEEVSAAIFDINNDGKNDLFSGSGGADFYGKRAPLLNSFFIKSDSTFQKMEVDELFGNASVIAPFDFDKDGDMDVFVGNQMITNDFGNIPESYLLVNDNGQFSKLESSAFDDLGMLTDAIWSDYNNDGNADLIIVGEWMAPKILMNTGDGFQEEKTMPSNLNGLWQTIEAFDIDNDGDLDYVLGNWGTNSKFRANPKSPLVMYYNDFDKNGSTETIVCNEMNGDYFPILGLDELSSQMVSLRKKFPNFSDFAGQPIQAIFDKEQLKSAQKFEVHTLSSGYLKNEGSSFTFVPFKDELQVAPVKAMTVYDFDGDGKNELLLAGNFFGVTPYHGRFDSFSGALVRSEEDIQLGYEIGLDLTQRSARHLSVIELANKTYLLVTFNDDRCQVYKFND